MTYTVRDSAGAVIAGDDEVDDVMRAAAMLAGGSIVDESTGETVYTSKPVPTPEQMHAEIEQRMAEEIAAAEGP